MYFGDPLGDPQGILRGSYPKTGDPAFVRHIKIGGSGETTYPLYNTYKGGGELGTPLQRSGYELALLASWWVGSGIQF